MKQPLVWMLSATLLAFLITPSAWAETIPPRPALTPSPGYPIQLTDTGLSGGAVIVCTIKSDGSVADASVKTADHAAFGAAALAAVGGWRFEPGLLDGKPVDLKTSLPFNFHAPYEQQVNAAMKRKVFRPVTEPILGQDDFGRKPKVKKNSPPAYPRALARSGLKEKVRVQFVIAPDGTTLNPKVLDNPRQEFVNPAIDAVARTTYQPPVKDGHAVYVEMTTILTFEEEAPPAQSERGRGGQRGGGRGRRGG